MIDCFEHERLETLLINLKREHQRAVFEAAKRGASEEEQQLLRERQTMFEDSALSDLHRHMAVHGCRCDD